MNNFKPGDLLVTYQRGRLGAQHVSLIASVFGAPLAYESTTMDRPRCVRTGRDDPKGIQAHLVEDVVGENVYHLPLGRPLYMDEEDRLLAVAESCLGRGYEFVGGTTASAFVARVLGEVGIWQHKNARNFSPRRLVHSLVRQGIYRKPVAII